MLLFVDQLGTQKKKKVNRETKQHSRLFFIYVKNWKLTFDKATKGITYTWLAKLFFQTFSDVIMFFL